MRTKTWTELKTINGKRVCVRFSEDRTGCRVDGLGKIGVGRGAWEALKDWYQQVEG